MIQPPPPPLNNFDPCIPLFITAVSPCDPDSRFSISSLARLEAAGIKVVTALEHHLKSIKTFFHAGLKTVTTLELDLKSIKIFTWVELLEFIIGELNLKELGQQIEAYLTGKTSCVPWAVLGFGFVNPFSELLS